MADTDYSAKRDFDKTSEPDPQKKTAAPRNAFVVHRHDARRLHYDLRLRVGGVLCSWAVPRGFSYNPDNKRLAVRTEDHPLAYYHFHGMIPKGEYGAGTIDIWDRGTYRLVRKETAADAIGQGELKIHLYGKRLRGEWHLIQTEDDNWLLFKARDEFSREGDSLLPLAIDPANLQKETLPAALTPMSPAATVAPFSDAAWVYELDFPGIRLFCGKKKGIPFIHHRNIEREIVVRLHKQLETLGCETALLDGVLTGTDGTLSVPPAAAALYLFDIVHWEDFNTRKLPLIDRKALLRSIIPESNSILFVDPVAEAGEQLASEAAGQGWSIVAKNARSPYQSGCSKWWKRMTVAAYPTDSALSSKPPRFKLSNPNKVFWPAEGYTKRDLYQYYEQVADMLVPHLEQRPVHLRRFPNGIEGKNFYQRQAPEKCPDWIQRVEHGGKSYLVCNDRWTLLYLINLGSIDLHPWLSRIDTPEIPDWLVVDIDAKESSFENAVKIARKTGGLLRGLGLKSYVKTSGGTGLHVFVPLVRSYTYEQSRQFAEALARVVAMENKDLATVERNPLRRRGRVYVDFLQNRKGQSIVPPYSARPVPAARVSMPLDWDELRRGLNPEMFTIKTAPARLKKIGDLFRPVLDHDQDLLPAIESLQNYVQGNV